MNNIGGVKRFLVIVCISLAVFSNFRCGPDSSSRKMDESTLTIFYDGDETALGPNHMLWLLVFLPLSIQDYRNPAPRLLESWEHSPDYIYGTGHMRKDIVWDDGVPVTAKDVKFSIDFWTHPDIWYENRFYKSLTVVDDYTVQFEFKKAFNITLHIYNWLPILPKHLVETLDMKKCSSWEFWKQPVGSGPYRYVRHVPKIMIELEANPNYYAEAPKIKRVILRFGGSPITELKSGNVDIVTKVTPLETVMLAKDPQFRVYYNSRYRYQSFLLWNQRLPFFNSPEVRKALTMAINRRELHKVLNYPEDIPICDVVTRGWHHFSDKVPAPLPFDPDQSKILLEKAGWVDTDNNGIREKDGEEFRFTLTAEPDVLPEAIYIQDQLLRVGVQVDIRSLRRNNLVEKVLRQYDFEAAMAVSDSLGNGQFDYLQAAGEDNPEYYKLIKEVWDALLPEMSDKAYFKLWTMFQADMPVTFLHPRMEFFAAHRRVKGLRNNLQGDLYSNVEYLWIEE